MNESILECYRDVTDEIDRREFLDEQQWRESQDDDNEVIDRLERARDMNIERGNLNG